MNRFWIYQRERFPLLGHGLVIVAFSASAIAFSAFARHAALPAPWLLAAGFLSSLCSFAQMRIADEWKDADEDRRYRPYRPVPRGLVTLRELAWIGVPAGVIQLVVALAIDPRLIIGLACVWAYFALMSQEFFAGRWLRAHPAIYVASHVAIVPMIDAYVSSFDWFVARVPAPHALPWFLAVTFCNGLMVEVGRKLRAPRDEEHGVETYTALWGVRRASAVWCVAFAATAILASFAAAQIGVARIDAPLFVAAFTVAAAFAAWFVRRPATWIASRIETISGAWTVAMYGALGLFPFALRGLP